MKNTVHFTVTGQFVTHLARNLWAEEELAKALRILMTGITGMDEPTALMICTGKAKLIGKNNKLQLRRDNAKTDDRDLPLFSLAEVVTSIDKKIKNERERGYESQQKLLRIFDKWGDDAADRVRHWSNPDEISREERLAEQIAPPPMPTKEYNECGWVAPNGDYFTCDYGGHIALANEMGHTERKLEQLGWVKISSEYILPGEKPITQLQRDTIWEYCQLKKKELPFWYNEDDF